MGYLCRGVGEGGHPVGEVAFAVGDGLLVAHRSVDVAVAGELHKLLGGGARDGGHGGGEVTQVVEADVGASDLVAGLVEAVAGVLPLAAALVVAGRVTIHLPRGERLPVGSGDHQRVGAGRREGRQVMAEVCADVWGQVDGASAGGGFRGGDHPGSADGDGGLLDGDRFL